MGWIEVQAPGLLTTVQDRGRRGYEHLGVMVGGVLDDYAAAWANRLLGNPPEAAVLEMTLVGPTLAVVEGGWAALAGADLGARVDGEPWPPGTARRLAAGSVVRFGRAVRGARAYLAFAGGLDVPPVLGSRATDLVSGFGGVEGRALVAGDRLRFGDQEAEPARAPVDTCLVRDVVRVLPGVRLERFPPTALERLAQGVWRVSPRSDRVGLRLEGPPVVDTPMPSDAISEAMAIGAVEVPPSGELLVLLKARGTIGGYATLAHVVTADLPVLAQLRPGESVRFRVVGEDEALEAVRRLWATLTWPLERPEAEGPAAAEPAAAAPERLVVPAPSWCVVWRANAPGERPLVEVGDRVEAGQPLALVEVMKVFTPLASPARGTVTAIHFADGAVVEEGAPLVELAVERT
ncbi:MAG: 5-oxoprolinase/urea amidolyase family protein [Actinomycetia bacterium]|nr:5-oxoprolinase/urea amidolyase family protein [Actinomycetes bacterium]